MPTVDSEDRVVGMVLKEDKETGRYMRNYMALDFGTYKLRLYTAEAELAKNLSDCVHLAEINCQYITKVGVASSRPKALNCFEISTTTGPHFLSVDSAEERDEWIEAIRKSSMRQGSAKQVVSALKQKQKKTDISYQTKVVGGVVQRIPVQSKTEDGEEEGRGVTDGSPLEGAIGEEHVHSASLSRRTRGYPRIIQAGHGIKLGAVMKNWKKRFFVLTETSLGYYKSIEETDPIKTISVGEICSVAPSKECPGKDNLFELVTPSRTFYVQVDNEEELRDWVQAFNSLLKTVRPSQQPPTQQVDDLRVTDSDEELQGTLV